MYAGPTDQSAVVSQAIYGSNVKLLTAQGEWCKSKPRTITRDGFPVTTFASFKAATAMLPPEKLFRSKASSPIFIARPTSPATSPTVTIPFESHLEVIEEGKGNNEGWLKLRLPDKRIAWIQSGDIVSDPKPSPFPNPSISPSDSSAFRTYGVAVPVLVTTAPDSPRCWCALAASTCLATPTCKRPGPESSRSTEKISSRAILLFFGSSPENITHTGMYIGDGQFIHDTTSDHPVVQISRLDDAPWTKLLVASRRVK